MIPEIDIWRAASLMLKRYGEKPCFLRTLETGDYAVGPLANQTPIGPLH